MKAAVYRQNGPSSVLSVEELPIPEPGPGEVRVKVVFSGVNPTDWKTRSGTTAGAPQGFQVPHKDGAGVVDALGPGVSGLQVGQRVWVYLAGAYGSPYGTAAEYTVVPAERVVPLPDHASAELGASLGVPALTAAHCLGGHPAELAGAKVLVAGGAGAVGHFAIELAKQAGASVATTVSNAEKAKLAEAAGADLVVNYREEDAIKAITAWAPQVQRIVEVALGANLELDLAVTKAGTVISIYANEAKDPVLPTRRLMAANARLHYVLVYSITPQELAAARSWVVAAVGQGALTTLPVHVFPLGQVAAAQDAVEHGAVGKVLVVPG